MTEQRNSPSNDEEPYPQPFTTRGVDAFKCVEDYLQVLGRDADASVIDVNSHVTI